MAERGAVPTVAPMRRRALRLIGSFTSPLAPDDYLELVNPLWSTRELRGRVEGVRRESATAVTVTIKPGWEWPGHLPGQYVRLGIEVDGVHHWRAYSLTSDPERRDGRIAITPKLLAGGKVSPFLFHRVCAGAIVRLGGVEGTFVLPSPLPSRLLFVSAGSGVTPIMSMLRSLARDGALRDVVHVHCARDAADVIFRRELHGLHERHAGIPSVSSGLRERHAGMGCTSATPATGCTSGSPAHGPPRPRARRAVPRLARARGARVRPRRPVAGAHRALARRG